MPYHNRKNAWCFFIVACLLFILPKEVQAIKVYSPLVTQGETAIEYQLDYSLDGDPAVNTNSKHQMISS